MHSAALSSHVYSVTFTFFNTEQRKRICTGNSFNGSGTISLQYGGIHIKNKKLGKQLFWKARREWTKINVFQLLWCKTGKRTQSKRQTQEAAHSSYLFMTIFQPVLFVCWFMDIRWHYKYLIFCRQGASNIFCWSSQYWEREDYHSK